MAAGQRKDYYKTLGVPRGAKPGAIRTAYRHLARRHHPDVNPGDPSSEERFREIQEAYDVLSDQKKRKFYDRHGFYTSQAGGSGPGGTGRPGGFGFEGFDFGNFGGQPGRGPDLSSIFESVLGGRHRQNAQATDRRPGEDLEYALDIGFHDAITGTTVRLNVQRLTRCSGCAGSGSSPSAPPHQCTQCGGSGKSQAAMGNMRFNVACPACGGERIIRTPCGSCQGEGRVSRERTVKARIPSGTGDNSRLRVPRMGNAGVRGGRAGDLYIIARLGSHPFFERKGNDIHVQVPITPAEAILGAKIEVPTIDGTAFLRVPPATGSGKTFRVRERGVRDSESGIRGDQFVRISIAVPEIPDENTKELMRQYAEMNPENPRDVLLGAS